MGNEYQILVRITNNYGARFYGAIGNQLSHSFLSPSLKMRRGPALSMGLPGAPYSL